MSSPITSPKDDTKKTILAKTLAKLLILVLIDNCKWCHGTLGEEK